MLIEGFCHWLELFISRTRHEFHVFFNLEVYFIHNVFVMIFPYCTIWKITLHVILLCLFMIFGFILVLCCHILVSMSLLFIRNSQDTRFFQNVVWTLSYNLLFSILIIVDLSMWECSKSRRIELGIFSSTVGHDLLGFSWSFQYP